jgi:hypothetical protein
MFASTTPSLVSFTTPHKPSIPLCLIMMLCYCEGNSWWRTRILSLSILLTSCCLLTNHANRSKMLHVMWYHRYLGLSTPVRVERSRLKLYFLVSDRSRLNRIETLCVPSIATEQTGRDQLFSPFGCLCTDSDSHACTHFWFSSDHLDLCHECRDICVKMQNSEWTCTTISFVHLALYTSPLSKTPRKGRQS